MQQGIEYTPVSCFARKPLWHSRLLERGVFSLDLFLSSEDLFAKLHNNF